MHSEAYAQNSPNGRQRLTYDRDLGGPSGSLAYTSDPRNLLLLGTSDDSDTVDDISSNDTASNNPGPGRLLGTMYSFLGRKVEKLAYKVTSDRPRARETRVAVYDSTSSNQTGSNNPGPGRQLGRLYMYFGRGIERQLGNLADRIGFGPAAVAFEIKQIIEVHRFLPGAPHIVHVRLSLLSKRLLRYTQYV